MPRFAGQLIVTNAAALRGPAYCNNIMPGISGSRHKFAHLFALFLTAAGLSKAREISPGRRRHNGAAVHSGNVTAAIPLSLLLTAFSCRTGHGAAAAAIVSTVIASPAIAATAAQQ